MHSFFLQLPNIFQFTPLREGRRRFLCALRRFPFISIHAPPRGATIAEHDSAYGRKISIHAPPRGATTGEASNGLFVTSFQFTPLREGRRAVGDALNEEDLFQFTPLREGRPLRHKRRRAGGQFQFTPLREGRQFFKCRGFLVNRISIHAPPRGATHKVSVLCTSSLFQFTPLREGRLLFSMMPLVWRIFQFTPLREGRQQKICNFCKSFVQPLQISMA